ncbi:MAG: hypothetical protein PHI44_05090 [Candidatus Ratteibacteria bacterium]|nr:hypothetical protein [Candidatus Ratteibacteria bacterium]
MEKFFTKRAFITGLIMSIVIAFVAQYSVNITHSSYMAIDHMPAGGIFLFFLLVFVVNTLLKFIKPSLSFAPGELLLIYIMLLVASSVTEMGLGSQLLPIISGPMYYASPENQWDTIIFPHLKKFLIVNDKDAARYFFEGLPSGMRIPWGAWLKPISVWLSFLLTLYFVMFCVASILRKQWVEKERLVYPLTILPKEMVREADEKGKLPPFFKNPLMWLGFSIAFIIMSMKALHFYFPMFPQVPLAQNIPIFRRTVDLKFFISFPVIGFTFFVNLNLLFSIWFFNILFKVIRGSFNIMGIASAENVGIYGCSGEPIFNHFGMGAMVVMVAYSLWISRAHLKDVWYGATGKKHVDDTGEVMSYKAAFWGLVFGSLFLTGWLICSGMTWYIAVLFLICAFIIWLVLTRVVCEGGIPTLVATSIASAQIISSCGSSHLAPMTIVALGMTYVYAADIRTFPLSSMSMGLKISSDTKKNSLGVFWAIMCALTINIIVTLALQLRLGYKYGGINMNDWYFRGNVTAPYKYVAEMIRAQTAPNKIGWICKGIGALTMYLFLFMRQHFLWWPFHPIGLVIAPVVWIDTLWFSIFIAWLIKFLIMRYGGVQVYEKIKYFFLGLPLGVYTCAGVWFIVDLFTGKIGNQVFWI